VEFTFNYYQRIIHDYPFPLHIWFWYDLQNSLFTSHAKRSLSERVFLTRIRSPRLSVFQSRGFHRGCYSVHSHPSFVSIISSSSISPICGNVKLATSRAYFERIRSAFQPENLKIRIEDARKRECFNFQIPESVDFERHKFDPKYQEGRNKKYGRNKRSRHSNDPNVFRGGGSLRTGEGRACISLWQERAKYRAFLPPKYPFPIPRLRRDVVKDRARGPAPRDRRYKIGHVFI